MQHKWGAAQHKLRAMQHKISAPQHKCGAAGHKIRAVQHKIPASQQKCEAKIQRNNNLELYITILHFFHNLAGILVRIIELCKKT